MRDHLDVSRETSLDEAPLAPPEARGVFPSGRLALAQRYAEMLATDGVSRGLIGPREVPRVWERHILNCAVVAEVVPDGSTVCDVGSGAGLPGLVLAIARPDLQLTLVESLLRRATFLQEASEALGLKSVQVLRSRAEDLREREFDVVTSRAVAPLNRLLGWSMPLVKRGGVLVAMKGESVEEEIEGARVELGRWTEEAPEVLRLGDGVVFPQAVVVRVARR